MSEGNVGEVSILLVDDHRADLLALRAMLECDGYRIMLAESGEQALNLVLREDFAVILLDVAMPGMDGFETADRIRQTERSRHVPIIFVTAYATDAEAIARGYAKGGIDYLLKPLHVETVRAKVAFFAELRRELQRTKRQHAEEMDTVRRLAAAHAAVAEAVASVPEDCVLSVLETLALQAQSITGAAYVAVGVGTNPEEPFQPWVSVGVSNETARAIGRFPRPVGTLGKVALEGVVVRVPDVRHHPAHRGFPPHHPKMSSYLGMPIRFRGQSVGNIYLANKRGADEFTERDEELVGALAARAGIAIETARLYQAEGMGRIWLASVIEEMPEAVVVLDADGRLAARNRTARGLADDEGEPDVAVDSVSFALSRTSGERVRAAEWPGRRALLHDETIVGEEFLVQRKSGEVYPVLLSAAPIHSRTGETIGATITARDITQLKRLETRRIEWATMVAHDLLQPVSVIALSAQTVQRKNLPPDTRAPIDRIGASARQLTEMVNDLLDISCTESGRISVRQRDVELSSLVHAVVERVCETIPHCELRLAPGANYPVSADPSRIEQVLVNLLVNAVKHGEPGLPIVIDMCEHGGEVEIVVTNRGQGIPVEELPNVFGRFARTRDARAQERRGLGLGLYICKGIVEAHGGRIWVESIPGDTTSFHFTIPLARNAGRAERRSA